MRERVLIGLAVALAFLALIVADGVSSRPHTSARVADAVPECPANGVAMRLTLHRPDRRQGTGVYEARSHQPVATIVVRNVSDHRCHIREPFTFSILDRSGKSIASWNDQGDWFDDDYLPNGDLTFSVPAVDTCDRPGPYTAVAAVGDRTARLDGLGRRAITCAL